ncbi:histidine phosphatase family protein [Candidatus Enterococcus leclercqii]|uniref:histidine phosphatase family protein n=1 Tax=Enterococcus TaxID=1350 RepID=UPI00137ACF70|nr:histidine phosphatase family protein [Enterococcus sp. CU9D]KAF1292801.1 phosphoglycerate kinase [Enterococcus sp. CU9D]
MKSVYFVRHSIRDFTNREERLAPLTSEGLMLARRLQPFFADKKISNIYSSPYLRAVQTIEPTAEWLGKTVIIEDDLRERAVGKWCDNFSEFSTNQWNDFNFKLANGESLNEVQQRILPIYNEIIKKNEANIIISGHGTALSALFNELLDGKFGLAEFNKMKMPDIYCAEYKFDSLTKFEHIERPF